MGINKKAQITIFIIIAIAIVLGIVLFFVFKERLNVFTIPADFEGVYSYYLDCIEAEVLFGASILGQQGGYIENPDFSPGSEYMPFSSQLDFLGIGIPYWYYISGNGISQEQIPSKRLMESQLDDFLKERLVYCDFSQFENKGYEIDVDEIEVKTKITRNSINIGIDQDILITFGESNWRSSKHSVSVSSNLGKFYDLSQDIYEDFDETMFLENYGLDILRLYAPVDGVELSCSPQIWFVDEIRSDLINALESNIPFTKIKGDYYSLSKEENKYFIHDIGRDVNVDVNFVYLGDWPTKLEVWPSEEGFLKADPVGLQEGLGILGFCYAPYHFVYDFAYPVLIQLYSGSEMFQFPIVVYINKNKPREALSVQGLPDVVPELCKYKNTQLRVYTYNTNLEPVEANIKFKCLGTSCDIGKTKINPEYWGDAGLEGNFPKCENGFVIASAEGYKTSKQMVSSIDEASVSLYLDKKYKLDFEVTKKGIPLKDDFAVVTFTKDDDVITIAYPEQKEIELTAGQYKVKAYVYTNSNIQLKGSQTQKCVDAPKQGLFGMLGLTEKKCFTMDIPSQLVSFAVSGGGTEDYYIKEYELGVSKKLTISTERFEVPSKVEDLQLNYNKVEESGLNIFLGS